MLSSQIKVCVPLSPFPDPLSLVFLPFLSLSFPFSRFPSLPSASLCVSLSNTVQFSLLLSDRALVLPPEQEASSLDAIHQNKDSLIDRTGFDEQALALSANYSPPPQTGGPSQSTDSGARALTVHKSDNDGCTSCEGLQMRLTGCEEYIKQLESAAKQWEALGWDSAPVPSSSCRLVLSYSASYSVSAHV